MTDILFSKQGQITVRLTFLAIYLLCKFDKPSCNILVLEHLNDFKIIGYCSHFVFQNKAQILLMQKICLTELFMVCKGRNKDV